MTSMYLIIRDYLYTISSLLTVLTILFIKNIRYNDSIDLINFLSSSSALKVSVSYVMILLVTMLIKKFDNSDKKFAMNKYYSKMWIYIISLINISLVIFIFMNETFSKEDSKRYIYISAFCLTTIICYFTKYFPQNKFIGIRTNDTFRSKFLWEKSHQMLSQFSIVIIVPFVIAFIAVDFEKLVYVVAIYVILLLGVTMYYIEYLKRNNKEEI